MALDLPPIVVPADHGGPVQIRVVLDDSPLLLARGDLLFGNRLSPMQRAMVVSGDPWTHSALVGAVDGELRTIEIGPAGCFSRSLEEFADAYRFVGHARLAMGEHCVDAVATVAETALQAGRLTYSYRTCAVIEAAALARRLLPGRLEARVVGRTIDSAASHARRLDPSAVTCSGLNRRSTVQQKGEMHLYSPASRDRGE